MTVSPALFRRFYPGTSRSGTIFFYGWMRRECAQPYRALNLGAGPGDLPGSENFTIRDMRCARGIVSGCDPDPEVLKNAQLDEALVMERPSVIPFPDESFEVVYSDYVLEHVEFPKLLVAEVWRVLKPGGSFFFRTPNAWHYVSIAALLLPHWVHRHVANRVRGLGADSHEPYPTFHRMNTRWILHRLCLGGGFRDMEVVMFEGEPSYLVFNTAAFLMGVAYERLVNGLGLLQGVRANIIGKMVK
jgi:SAM-dependent methyltransferase